MDSAKHSGIISLFNQHFVKSGLIEKNCSKILSSAQIHRQRSDYGDYVIATEQEATEQIQKAEQFIREIKKYIDSMLSND